ncbi:ribosome assembly factor SBDS [Candidatus Woesearchaeota archaeon]|nr:ribosome assembly factor SBDS [Candidatus Woesearchaeota archaeon]
MKGIKTFDKEKVTLNIAKLRKGGEVFEVIIDPDSVINYKSRKTQDVRDVLKSHDIFSDAKKGMLASEQRLEALFGTSNPLEIAATILDEGEIQFTQEYREQIRKEKINRIIEIIARNAVDPRSGLPHPRNRIENAIDEAKIRIDEFKGAEDQIQDIIQKMRPILPIKFAVREIQIKIPPTYAGKAYSSVSRFGKILMDNWQSDGSWLATVEIPAGIQNEFFDALNKLTHGEIETKIIKER